MNWPNSWLLGCRRPLAAVLGLLVGCVAYGSGGEHPASGCSKGKGVRSLEVSVLGGADDLVLRDPKRRSVTSDSAGVPGATMFRYDGAFPGVPATVVEIEWPLEGAYSIAGVARDSTWLGLNVTGSIDFRGRCTASAGGRAKKGHELEWMFEYRMRGGDSCEVTVIGTR